MNAPPFSQIVAGAGALVGGLKAAGLSGPFVIGLLPQDGEQLRSAVGNMAKIRVENGLCKFTTADLEFRWPAP